VLKSLDSPVWDTRARATSRWLLLRVGADARFNSCYAASQAAQNLGVGLRRPCQGRICGGMLGAMECIAPARPAKLRSTPHRRSALVMSAILNEYNANTALVYV
jgi:hypothetical protein